MSTLGLRLSAGSGGWEKIEKNTRQQRGYALTNGPFGLTYTMPANGYVWWVGAFMRRANDHSGKRPRIWFGIYETADNGEPARLLGRTERLEVGNNAQEIGGAITWVNPLLGSPGNSGIRVDAGQLLAIALKVENENVEVATIGPQGDYFYRNFGAEGVPPSDPFFAEGSQAGNPLALFAEWIENTAPVAVQASPANGAALNPQAVALQAVLSDAQQGAPAYDRLTRVHFEVSRATDSAILWDAIVDATPAERLAQNLTRLYAGLTLLEPGTPYRWRAQVADDHYTWSQWTGYRTFTINPAGQVDTATDGVPNSKIDAAPATILYTARWHHPAGLTANQVLIRLLRNGQVVAAPPAQGVTIASSALPGTPFTIPANTAANLAAGFGILSPGAYQYQMALRATDGQWSPWSAPRDFTINSPPVLPTNLQPPTGAAVSAIPLLEWNIDDPDADDVFGVDADSEILLTRPNGSTVTLTTSAYDAATGRGSLQLTTVQVNAFGLYRWQVRGRDTSAGARGIGAWSAPQTFQYINGPVVTVNTPAAGATVGQVQPTIAFSTSAPVARSEVRLFEVDAALPRHGSGQLTLAPPASAGVYTFPPGWVRNDRDYDLEIAVWTDTNVEGRSLRIPFHVAFAPAEPVPGFEASAIPGRHDPDGQTSIAVLSWGLTQFPPGEFGGYNVYRRLATEGPEAWTLLRTLTAPGQTTWRDEWAPPNRLLLYGIAQMQRVGAGDEIDTVESAILEAQVELIMETAVLTSVYDPSKRFVVMHLAGSRRGRSERPKASFVTWGSKNKATTITTPAEFTTRTEDLGIVLRTDSRGSLYDHMAAWEDLVGSGHPVCYRPERTQEFMYCEIDSWDWGRGSVGTRELSFTLKEIDFTPGSAGGS